MTRRTIGVDERPPLRQTIPLSLQHLFAMFGATVLVPILFKINPATILLFNGIGTLFYLFICKGRIPAYLGSSFAFISPVLLLLPLGYELALGGFIVCGLLFCLVSLIVKIAGRGWLNVMFPPAAMGAIVAVIGLELAGVAADMAGLRPAAGTDVNTTNLIISMVTLAVTILGSVMFRGFMAIIPILIGVLVGYALSFFMGVVDFTPVREAPWFALPTFYTPRFEWFAIMTILPAALVVIAEHVGHLVVTANIVQKDLLKNPGLHRSMFANGFSTIISGFFGSTPNTTYGENIGVMALTRVYSTWVIGGAAILAILLSCVGKLAAAIQIIPVPVMGGVSLLLYGVIGASGIRVLIDSKVDYSKAQNLILTSVILIIGVSGAKIQIGAAELKGMALATVVGIGMSLIFKLISIIRPDEPYISSSVESFSDDKKACEIIK
ncbi:uracil permease [Xenorhabdus stockiae]|uniref:uracil permease n=1 Tax=Xenorhabdus stockiae TaxID=351614 RepID=UPI003CEE0854